jgi:hypothetical protein
MSTLIEIEEAIRSLPPDEVAALANWLDELQAVNSPSKAYSDECLAGQLDIARRRMEALDAGQSVEVTGGDAHAIVRKSIGCHP